MGIYVNPPSPPFGKSMAADMLTAYYSRGCNSAALFEGRKAKTGEAFQEHLNRHHVIRLDIQKFLETTGRIFGFTEEEARELCAQRKMDLRKSSRNTCGR